MVFDDLKKANMEAMKAHDQNARGVYSVLINKCMLKSVELKAKNQELQVYNINLKSGFQTLALEFIA